MKSPTFLSSCYAALVVALFALPAFAAEQTDVGQADQATLDKVYPAKPLYSPYAGRNFPTRPFFGDTHLHTSFSMDAGAFGCRLGPRDAYRFARGEEVTSSTGQRVKLSRPLDFLVVADHSDGFGFFPTLMSGDPTLLATPQGRKWYDQINSGHGAEAAMDIIMSFGKGELPNGFPLPGTTGYRSAWQEIIKAAEDFRLQRPGPLHGVHRVRMDLEHQGQQPASQCHLPWQRRTGQPGRTAHHLETAGQRQSRGSVEMDGRHRRKDRQ